MKETTREKVDEDFGRERSANTKSGSGEAFEREPSFANERASVAARF